MLQTYQQVDTVRKHVARRINPKRKAELGQFMTPGTVSRFMASLFSRSTMEIAHLLDPGAGIGSLTGAFLDRFAARDSGLRSIRVAAYEIDPGLRTHLVNTLAEHQTELPGLDCSIFSDDFIEQAVNLILEGSRCFSHAILNPPYKKVNSTGRERLLLRKVGIETVNLYSAFVGLTVKLMQPGGDIVAIIPRSFCNGPYYRPFRDFLLAHTDISGCICLRRVIVPSETMTFCRKTSSFCSNAMAGRVALRYPPRQMTFSLTLKRMFIPSTRSLFPALRNASFTYRHHQATRGLKCRLLSAVHLPRSALKSQQVRLWISG